MKRIPSVILILALKQCLAQQSLDFFISQANRYSPVLSEFNRLQDVNKLQHKLNKAENAAF